jgi:YD repeat-containing protein
LSVSRTSSFLWNLRCPDTSGNVATATKIFEASGQVKVGEFTVSFQDLAVPAPGIPITVTRTYDSRTREQPGDFGNGWTYAISKVTVSQSSVMGASIIQTSRPIGNYGIEYGFASTLNKFIDVTLPTGQVEHFVLGYVGKIYVNPPPLLLPGAFFSPPQSPLPGPLSEVQLFYAPVDGSGTTSTLEALTDNTVEVAPAALGAVQFLDRLTGQVYNPTRWKLTTADRTVFILDDSAGVQSITDRNGNAVTFSPNAVVQSSGQQITVSRDSQGRITTITDPMGGQITYGYDFYGDLVSVTDQLGNVTRYTYDSDHRLLEIFDPLGRRGTRSEYDASGRLIATVDAQGNRVDFAHDLTNRQEVTTDQRGNVTVRTYDARGNVLSITNALGQTTKFTYDDQGNQRTVTDPLGNTTTSVYDDRHNVLQRIDPLGDTVSATYNARGQLLTATDARGNTTTNAYDDRGNLLTITDPLGHVTSFTYDAYGGVLTKTDAAGEITQFGYDRHGNLTSQTDPMGNTVTFTYDANGHQLTASRTRTDASGNKVVATTTSVYDPAGHVIKNIDEYGNVTTNTYTSFGALASTTNVNGAKITYQYDVRGFQTATVYADGTFTATTYDAAGNRTSAQDKLGKQIQYTYDALNRVQTETTSGGNTITHVYDAAGRQTATIDAAGNKTTYVYTAGITPKGTRNNARFPRKTPGNLKMRRKIRRSLGRQPSPSTPTWPGS